MRSRCGRPRGRRAFRCSASAAGCSSPSAWRAATSSRTSTATTPARRFTTSVIAVRVAPGSRLAAILGSGEAAVNTLHHQAVRRLPDGWRPVAVAGDGLVEGAEPEQGPWFVGIQWHPELMLDQPAGQAMFDGLVAAAGQSSPAQSSRTRDHSASAGSSLPG